MDNLREWYEQAAKVTLVHKAFGSTFVIYKGFKISSFDDGSFEIFDTRFSDVYTKVSLKDMKVFKSKGFIKGANLLMYDRDVKRVKDYTKKLEKLYSERDKYNQKLETNVSFYSKRIKNCEDSIQSNLDLLFFYSSRVKQFKN